MTTFGGVASIPKHKSADMHGLVRVAVGASSRLKAGSILSSAGLPVPPSMWLAGIWRVSDSIVEKRVTEDKPGRVFVCRLIDAYLEDSKYIVLGYGAGGVG